jgi:DUF971 family protein
LICDYSKRRSLSRFLIFFQWGIPKMISRAIFIRTIRQKDHHWFTIEWSDGKISDHRLSELQRQCPCARCHDEKTGKQLMDPSKIDDDVKASRIVSVGNYALQIFFTKGCSKGIYPFWLLRQMNR